MNRVRQNRIAPAVANTSWDITYSSTLATALTNMMNAGVFLATSAGGAGGKSGTSMATPHAAGIAALHKQAIGNGSQAAIHAWIVNNASTGKVTGSLSGTPNRLLNKRTL